jgi:ABC-type branched-subunit amino acid transport system substrate-binding protein
VTNPSIGVVFDSEDTGRMHGLLTAAVRAGLAASSFAGDVEVLSASPNGLPGGSEQEFRHGFRELADGGVLAIIGPGITDNGYVARDLADEIGIACVIWAAHEQLRSQWAFHFQLGSLEDEALTIVQHLLDRQLRRVALVSDETMNARRHVEWFDVGCRRAGIQVVARATMAADISDARSVVDSVDDPGAEVLVYFGRGPSAFPLGLAVQAAGWKIPVVGNSSLTHGRMKPDRTAPWDGWVYLDMFADTPGVAEVNARLGPDVAEAPVALSFYDMGRLVGEALSQASYLTRASVRDGFERVKHLPATVGYPGTMMSLGYRDRVVLKGRYLVLRQWQNQKSVEYTARRA